MRHRIGGKGDDGQRRRRDAGAGRRGALRLARADFAQHGHAIDIRHRNIEDHQIEGLAFIGLERLGPVGHQHRGDAQLAHHRAQDHPVGPVVIGRQHPQPLQIGGIGGDIGLADADFRQIGARNGQRDAHGGSLARGRAEVDGALHHVHQTAHDRHAQPGPAKAAGNRAVGLAEFLEHLLHLRLGHADAGVAHHQQDAARIAAIDLDRDRPGLGEFHRVRNDVVQDLQEAVRIAQPRAQPVAGQRDGKGNLLFRGLERVHRFDPLRQIRGDERQRLDLHLVGLDLGHVQKIVDDAQQQRAGIVHHLDHAALVGVGNQPFEHLGHAQHAVQRRAHLVAHLGEEIRLGGIGAVRLLQRLLPGAFGADLIGDIDHCIDDPRVRGIRRPHRCRMDRAIAQPVRAMQREALHRRGLAGGQRVVERCLALAIGRAILARIGPAIIVVVHAQHLRAGGAHHGFGGIVGKADDALRVEHDDPHRRGGQDRREEGAFLGQFGLRGAHRLVGLAPDQDRADDIGHRLQQIDFAGQEGMGIAHPVKADKAIGRPLRAHRHQQDRADRLFLERDARGGIDRQVVDIRHMDHVAAAQILGDGTIEFDRQRLKILDHRIDALGAPFVRVAGDLARVHKDIAAVAGAIFAQPGDSVVDAAVGLVDGRAQEVVQDGNDQGLNSGQARLVADGVVVHACLPVPAHACATSGLPFAPVCPESR